MADKIFVFAGPSLFGTGLAPASTPYIEWLAPARRGDVEQLKDNIDEPGTIGLADGTFHTYPSVSHVEIRDAIGNGWKVFGLCSMGAIRAAEMQHMGVHPWGRVAEHFCRHPETPDDEVALVHGDEIPFVPLSEPLVHIREFLLHMERAAVLHSDQAAEVAAYFSGVWYGERTLEALRESLLSILGVAELPQIAAQALSNFSRFRLKQADLISFVSQQPWLEK
ncbi:hypothetical protein CDN99_21995 [Roseateles aquatilis]|uniref:TfuA-like core domain-containing protein n=1 Tax=Roseateles aquatilis TaxID=431061 RepID=A0A246IZJ6_9BURK|nr:TfuA-like protein [Roseateles aquatilis]OWQ85747.1 hypothetical protein CDN99_21995 [Roseateles aquatilis]